MAGKDGVSAADDVVELHVVSDATGETATRVVAATEAQFPSQPFVTVRHPRAETVADLQLALARIAGRRAVVIFTIVEPTLRSVMRGLCEEAGVDYCDLLAEPLAAVAKVSGASAELRPGARPPLDETYFKRIAAIEFAVSNDDGLGRGLDEADVVLVGVSRTSKTPLSIYLGYLGWKAMNVPLIKGIEPSAQLFEVDPARIVGLTIDARRLSEIRLQRLSLMGGDGRYADLNEVYEDLEHAEAIHRRLGCPVIDVSELSIEEIALRVIRSVERASGERNGG
jgi:[pyruvate, water dikinase]-phosphate phosphotransferase / [pyruvate, water dikinase] kinase